MKLFIMRTEDPEMLLEKFKQDPAGFLVHQEFMTKYKNKTIGQLLDEIQQKESEVTAEEIYASLSKAGKRRYSTILKQLNYLIETEADRYVAGKKYKCISAFRIERFDEDGNSTDEFMEIEEGSVWEIDDKANVIGGEVHIKNQEKLEWLEVSKNTLFLYFDPVE